MQCMHLRRSKSDWINTFIVAYLKEVFWAHFCLLLMSMICRMYVSRYMFADDAKLYHTIISESDIAMYYSRILIMLWMGEVYYVYG